MRRLILTPIFVLPTMASAHAGHVAGTGHDLWFIVAVFVVVVVVAIAYGVLRKI